MYRRIVLLGMMLWAGVLQASPSSSFPPPGMSLPEYWGEENVWWHGRATFSGEVIVPACVLAMEDAWQAIDMGETPLREMQRFASPEKRFQIRLRECELAGTGKRVFTGSRIRVTFDGVRDETPDRFSTSGDAKGVALQILDDQGYIARAGEVMPAQMLSGNEQGLDYTLRLVRNQEVLSAGSYYASIRFRVDYE
ncbi:type 1 fimbrial protein [Salmonella enterica]|nr:type 1 fimbrial protein [Salmonella enterica]EHY0218367.1 type 1 fimbrial protein [Salmonella enterica]ELC4946996.1 type 1 fimbrial protein [Salmonella enterica]ELI8702836.1 type 1 fimbrial protein [Salmonella enterica]